MIKFIRNLLRPQKRKEFVGPVYDLYSVMRSFFPPGFVSGFMRDDAVKMSPKQGLWVQVARRRDPVSLAYLMDEMPLEEPSFITARLEMSSYRTAFGAHIHYVVDPVTHRMYYIDNGGGPSTKDYHLWKTLARDHLRRVMRNCIKDY